MIHQDDLFILGAGFSKAINGLMPSMPPAGDGVFLYYHEGLSKKYPSWVAGRPRKLMGSTSPSPANLVFHQKMAVTELTIPRIWRFYA